MLRWCWSGSVHARQETVPASPTTRFEPMAMHLPGDATLTLEAVAGDGDAWNCTQAGCGAHGRTGRVLTNRSGIVLDNTLSRGYDGIIQVGRTTAGGARSRRTEVSTLQRMSVGSQTRSCAGGRCPRVDARASRALRKRPFLKVRSKVAVRPQGDVGLHLA